MQEFFGEDAGCTRMAVPGRFATPYRARHLPLYNRAGPTVGDSTCKKGRSHGSERREEVLPRPGKFGLRGERDHCRDAEVRACEKSPFSSSRQRRRCALQKSSFVNLSCQPASSVALRVERLISGDGFALVGPVPGPLVRSMWLACTYMW